MADGIETRSERTKGLGTFTGWNSPKALRRLSVVTVAYFLLSSVGFSYSQGSGSGLEPDQDNVTNLPDVCPMNLSCSDLSPQCIMCDFNTNCKYGMETNVTCSPRETVECEVRARVLFHSLPSLIIPLLSSLLSLVPFSSSFLIPHPPSLTLKGNRTFIRSFTWRFCYQLPEDMKCCDPNTTCNVSQS